jgi:aminoglycoside phosphotransferase family enzyme
MAIVFLTDRHAYKLKRPVCHRVLDFSTTAARRRDADAEVRLNRRLAPDVYLGTLSLTVDPQGRLAIAGHGQEVDTLVWMNRLPGDLALDRALARGAVGEREIRRVAEILVTFYREATRIAIEPDEYRARFGRDICENRDELLRLGTRMPQALVREIAAAQLRFLKAQGDQLDARVDQQWIVDGHGDLRPEHVFLTEPPVIIDCLEFDPKFRVLDVADELAYLSLECERLGATWVGPLVRRTCNRALDDAPPARLMAFYTSFRALLRAKIAIWHLWDVDAGQHDRWRSRALAYLDLAHAHLPDTAITR